ncbi:MAG: RNA methyltransferase [Bacteroidota bacterium]
MLTKREQKFIQSLKIKKYRTLENRFLVEGKKNVNEVVNSDFSIDMILATTDEVQSFTALDNLRIEVVNQVLLSKIGNFKTNEACLAVVQQKPLRKYDLPLSDHLFVLDGVGDPGNLGTIIRSLDWFGFSHLVCTTDCAEFYHPKTIASSMGSFTRVHAYYQDLAELLTSFQGVKVIGADSSGVSLHAIAISEPSIIIMGSESHGIRPSLEALLSERVSIPQVGGAESLNVGVATGILAYHLRNS